MSSKQAMNQENERLTLQLADVTGGYRGLRRSHAALYNENRLLNDILATDNAKPLRRAWRWLWRIKAPDLTATAPETHRVAKELASGKFPQETNAQ